VLQDLNDLPAARRAHERALAIVETKLDPEHPVAATILSNLAAVLTDLGDLLTAGSVLDRALAIREARLGVDHPTTVRTRQNLAKLRDIGKGDSR
jgi:Tetratricopeptide repeat